MSFEERLKDCFDIDLTQTLKELLINEAIYKRLLRISLTTTDLSLIELREAVASGRRREIENIAHELKGVYANLRITPLCDLAIEMYDIAASGNNMEKLESLFACFDEKFRQLKEILQSEVKEGHESMWKVLIVDDNLADLELLREVLSDMAETFLAMNGNEALMAYQCAWEKNSHFDLILLDMVMPEMNGLDILTQIRETERRKGIPHDRVTPIIMVTAYEMPFMQEFDGSCDDYFLKPIQVDLFKDKVRSKLRTRI